jgi:hypothetical protein
LKLLAKILQATSQGQPVSLVLIATEMTTQTAIELLGCASFRFVKVLEEANILFILVGKYRRVRLEAVMDYKKAIKVKWKHLQTFMMKCDEELDLYDF